MKDAAILTPEKKQKMISHHRGMLIFLIVLWIIGQILSLMPVVNLFGVGAALIPSLPLLFLLIMLFGVIKLKKIGFYVFLLFLPLMAYGMYQDFMSLGWENMNIIEVILTIIFCFAFLQLHKLEAFK